MPSITHSPLSTREVVNHYPVPNFGWKNFVLFRNCLILIVIFIAIEVPTVISVFIAKNSPLNAFDLICIHRDLKLFQHPPPTLYFIWYRILHDYIIILMQFTANTGIDSNSYRWTSSCDYSLKSMVRSGVLICERSTTNLYTIINPSVQSVLGLTSLSTMLQLFHDDVWMWQEA